MLAPSAWTALNFITAPFCRRCGVPFAYDIAIGGEEQGIEQDSGIICLSCLNRPPPFRLARAPLIYDDASRRLILAFKHGDKTHMAATFAPWMARIAKDMLDSADLLIPVPLHRWRLLSRRYNQSALLSSELARHADLPSYPLVLRRIRATPSQGHLNAVQRHENVRKAFAVHPAYKDVIAGKSVILVDDVYTTGATVRECAKTLLKAGAARVDILTLARTAKGL